MASQAALEKSSPAAASPPVDSKTSTAVDSTPDPSNSDSTAVLAPETTSSTDIKSDAINKNTPSSSPSISVRPRRGSSDEFGATGSLGSIAGSAVGFGGSSVGYDGLLSGLGVSSNSSSHDKNSNKDGKNKNSGNRDVGVGNSNNNNNTIGIINTHSSLKHRTSPNGRRPFRKRKASVDFSFPALSIDDGDSSYSVSQLLPQHHVPGLAPKGPMAAAGVAVSSSSVLMLPSNANRSRLYSDLTIPESLLASTPKNNPNSSSSSKQQRLQQHQQQQKEKDKDNPQKPNQDQPPNDDKHQKILQSVDALPAMGEDDSIPPIDNDTHSLLANHPPSPINSANPSFPSSRKDRGLSFASLHSQGQGLDRLDNLGVEAAISAARIRKGSSVESDNKSQNSKDTSYDGTLGSQSHRFLMEAFLGDGTESLVLNPSQRERLASFDAATEAAGKPPHVASSSKDNHGNSHQNMNNTLMSRERLNSIGGRRNRLESWGGMSDLSVGNFRADQNLESFGFGFLTGDTKNNSNNNNSPAAVASSPAAGASTDKTAALAATIYTSLANDVTGAANADGGESVSSFFVNDERIPTKISINNRDRLNSIASIGTDASALLRYSAMNGELTDAEFPADVHTFIQATMNSVEDQLADLATAVEAVSKDTKGDNDSEISSTASPLIGAASDVGSNRSTDSLTGRPRSSSINSMLQISVDYDAVAAAVHAAEAAAGCLDLTNFSLADGSSTSSLGSQRNHKKRSLPIHKKPPRINKKKGASMGTLKKKRASITESLASAKRQCVDFCQKSQSPTLTKMDDQEMAKLRERARAAAGYVPPVGGNGSVKMSGLPPKKRSSLAPTTPLHPARPSIAGSANNFNTPTISNTAASKHTTPGSLYSSGTPASSTKGQSSQKWESMFECLLQFIEQRREDSTAGMTEEQKSEWTWDGNVPTTYKTKDGKALGRWVNNQRSAKSKGTLKEEREKRLVDAGLKWSVLASNSWNEMLEELRLYVADQNKQGKKWDGNVPTNFRIKVTKDKTKSFLKDDDEDKNLGRWVNRQRSMFQAGKLRKDRQLALEKIGLKWSMLATTSWESMFETLCQYIKEKKKGGNEWDGNVPANYRTEDNPPRALGRWINRQRSAYGKSKLKPEYVVKLNEIGLKWSIHERRPTYHQYKADGSKSSSAKATAASNAAKPPPSKKGTQPAVPAAQKASKSPVTAQQNAVKSSTPASQTGAKPPSAVTESSVKSPPAVLQSGPKATPITVQSAPNPTSSVVPSTTATIPTTVQSSAKTLATVAQNSMKPPPTGTQNATKPIATVAQNATKPPVVATQANPAKPVATPQKTELNPSQTVVSSPAIKTEVSNDSGTIVSGNPHSRIKKAPNESRSSKVDEKSKPSSPRPMARAPGIETMKTDSAINGNPASGDLKSIPEVKEEL